MLQIASTIGSVLSAVIRLPQQMELAKNINGKHGMDENITMMGCPASLAEHKQQLSVNRFKFFCPERVFNRRSNPKQNAEKIARANGRPLSNGNPFEDCTDASRARHSDVTYQG